MDDNDIVIVSYALRETENPFGLDPNDLPIDEIADKIKDIVNETMRLK